MKTIVLTVLILCMVSTSLAGVINAFSDEERDDGKCKVSGAVLDPGMHKEPSDCGRICCFLGGTYELHICPFQETFTKGMMLGDFEDKSLPFPECCKRKIVPK